jgi:hypothetical protein
MLCVVLLCGCRGFRIHWHLALALVGTCLFSGYGRVVGVLLVAVLICTTFLSRAGLAEVARVFLLLMVVLGS